MEIPEGFVLVPKGGRPRKEARDMAVWLGCFLRAEHRDEHSKRTTEWAIAYFGFSEPADVRRAKRNAKRRTVADCLLMVVNEAVFYVPAVFDTAGRPSPRPGALGWAWADGMQEAVQIKVKRSGSDP